jgi:hypothetical protein
MKETRRLLLILSILVRDRRPMTAHEVQRRLPKPHRVHVRSVQRDLVALRRWMKLSVEKVEKPYRWSFPSAAPCPCCWR